MVRSAPHLVIACVALASRISVCYGEDTHAQAAAEGALSALHKLYKDGLLANSSFEAAKADVIRLSGRGPAASDVAPNGVYCCGGVCGHDEKLKLGDLSVQFQKAKGEAAIVLSIEATRGDEPVKCDFDEVMLRPGGELRFPANTSCALGLSKVEFDQEEDTVRVTFNVTADGQFLSLELELDHCEEDEGRALSLVEKPIFTDVLCLTVVGLVFLTIFFEKAKDHIEEYAGEEVQQLIQHLFGGLTILGFIGLVSFLAVKVKLATKLSVAVFIGSAKECEGSDGADQGFTVVHGPTTALERIYGASAGLPDENACMETEEYAERSELFTETLENLHMSIFGIMVVFIMQILFVVKLGHNSTRLWKSCELELNETLALEEKSRLTCRGPAGFVPHRRATRQKYNNLRAQRSCVPELKPLYLSNFEQAKFLLRFDRLKLRFVRFAFMEGLVPKSARAKWVGDTDWDKVFPERPDGEPDPKRHRWIPEAFTDFDMAVYFQLWQSKVRPALSTLAYVVFEGRLPIGATRPL